MNAEVDKSAGATCAPKPRATWREVLAFAAFTALPIAHVFPLCPHVGW